MTNYNSAAEIQKEKEAAYKKITENNTPPKEEVKHCAKAFLVGGIICAIAQGIEEIFLAMGVPQEEVGAPTASVVILIAVILTACGIYDKISQFAGAGTAVPITGFANTMSSAALEYKSEGYVLGVGGNMFKVAGPVIVFGFVSAFLVSILVALVETLA